ncbi:MAG: hypothetical protein RL318_2051 [Fibrobacterota bacterium]|jgi:uncharacterized iron-regulated membrane protein
MLKKFLFWAHLSLGLLFALPIGIMALTGALIAYEPQIVGWTDASLRNVAVPTSGQKLSMDSLAKIAQATRPAKLTSLTLSPKPTASVQATFGKEGNLYLDPWTGAVLGSEGTTWKVLHFVEEIHRWMGSREIGGPVTGAAVLACLFMAVSGLFLWWPRSLKAARHVLWPRSGLSGKARDWQWHNAFGVLALPCLVLLCLTGSVFSWKWAEALLFRSVGSEPPKAQVSAPPAANKDGKPKEKSDKGPRSKVTKDAPVAWQAALDTVLPRIRSPWGVIVLRTGQKSGEPFSVMARAPGAHKSDGVTFKLGSTGQVTAVSKSRNDAGSRLRRIMKPLHTGQYFGILGQTAMFLTSLSCALLVWTGTAMSLRRFRRRKPATA